MSRSAARSEMEWMVGRDYVPHHLSRILLSAHAAAAMKEGDGDNERRLPRPPSYRGRINDVHTDGEWVGQI